MLPRKHRMTHDKEFKNAFDFGRSYFSPLLNVVVSPEKGMEHFIIGFIVSNKVAKKAHDRNLIKRRLRAAMKNILDDLKGGGSIVVIAKKNAVGASYEDLENALYSLLHKSRVYGRPSKK